MSGISGFLKSGGSAGVLFLVLLVLGDVLLRVIFFCSKQEVQLIDFHLYLEEKENCACCCAQFLF